MTQQPEIEAKNIEQAIQIACDKFNISREKLKYDVISYGSTGIFGLGRLRKAKIRVTLPDGLPLEETAAGDSAERAEAGEIKDQVRALINETLDAVPEAAVDLGRDVLQRIADAIADDATIRVVQEDGALTFHINSNDSAILIGKHGQTLEAIQSLVEKIVNRQQSDRIRVHVDVEGYMESRKNSLIRQAERLADKCKRISKPVTVGYMNAHDRRIVHIALKEDSQVRTRSTGEGAMKKLVILPRHGEAAKRKYR